MARRGRLAAGTGGEEIVKPESAKGRTQWARQLRNAREPFSEFGSAAFRILACSRRSVARLRREGQPTRIPPRANQWPRWRARTRGLRVPAPRTGVGHSVASQRVEQGFQFLEKLHDDQENIGIIPKIPASGIFSPARCGFVSPVWDRALQVVPTGMAGVV